MNLENPGPTGVITLLCNITSATCPVDDEWDLSAEPQYQYQYQYSLLPFTQQTCIKLHNKEEITLQELRTYTQTTTLLQNNVILLANEPTQIIELPDRHLIDAHAAFVISDTRRYHVTLSSSVVWAVWKGLHM